MRPILLILPPLLLLSCTDSGPSSSADGQATATGTEKANGLCAVPTEDLQKLQSLTREMKAEFEVRYDCTRLRSARLSVEAESDDPREAALRFLDTWSALLPLGEGAAESLSVYRLVQDKDIDGWHVFLEVSREGVPLEQSTLRVDLAGGQVVGLDLSAGLAPLPSDVTPKVAAEEVAGLAREALVGRDGLPWQVSGRPRLFFRNVPDGAPQLVWGAVATALKEGILLAEGEVLLDAETGGLVELRTPPVEEANPDLEILDGSGVTGPCFWLFWTGGICDEQGCDSGAGSEAIALRRALTGWHSARQRWDGKDGWDGHNGQMEAVAYIDDYDNASYNPTCDQTRYGSGWAVLDVVGHENQHAVDEHTAELVYANQSGALDEHLADLHGEALEYALTGSLDWIVGVGLPGTASGGIRSLKNPGAFGKYPTHMQDYLHCDRRACGADEDEWNNIEVHRNSSIPNHVLYRVSEGGQHVEGGPTIQGIGLDATLALTRKVHQGWLHSGSDFGAYRGAMLNYLVQVERVQGTDTSAARCAVMNSWAAAGIGSFDLDCDGIVDQLDDDRDGDGTTNDADVCPEVFDPGQGDLDGDGIGDACDPDLDGDGWINERDFCPITRDIQNIDSDRNGIGDACQDSDGDGWLDRRDVCPLISDPDQADLDRDGLGDACDDDLDGDGVANRRDTCPFFYNFDQTDSDGDGLGDTCEDDDLDGRINGTDNCPLAFNADQHDLDRDGIGDACDPDIDGDALKNDEDACPTAHSEAYSRPHLDTDSDGLGDACDPCPEDAGFGGLYQPCLADRDGDGRPDAEYDWSWDSVSLPLDTVAVMELADVLLYPHPFDLPGLIPLPVCTGPCPDWREAGEALAIQTDAGVPHLGLVLDAQGRVVARAQAVDQGDGAYVLDLAFSPASNALPPSVDASARDGQYFLAIVPDPSDLARERPGAQALYGLSIRER